MNEIFLQAETKTAFEGKSCFPSYVEINGERNHFQTCLSMVLEDGKEYWPQLTDETQILRYTADFGAERLEFPELLWVAADGSKGDTFKLALRYEFDPSGATFVNAFFYGENLNAPAIRAFRLTHTLHLADYRDVKWEYMPRPASTNPTEVMLTFPERHIARGEERVLAKQLISKAGFTCWGSQGNSAYMEFFLEGSGVLDCKHAENVATSITWNEQGQAKIQWDFLVQETKLTNQIWQWRNQWGWFITNSRKERNGPPLRMYHFFDAIRHYPSDRQLEKMARNGADLVVLHEGWRSDVQNNCYPYNTKELKRSIDTAHRLGLRVCLYTRGSEQSVSQEYAPWFDLWLKKDWDGLYMDYGSAFNELAPASEWFPCGTFLYRRFVQRIHRLRERVGKGGILFSHTGSTFSALGMGPGMLDFYVSGEAEAGAMVKDRDLHDYYASSIAGPGSMWTAAFPEYGTAKMIPYLAIAGQIPHAPIGVQFESSSLMHSTEPGMEDRCLRPLWKLWGIFKNQKGIKFYNHLNSKLQNSSLITSNAETALLILANFQGKEATITEPVNWEEFGVQPHTLALLTPTCDTPGKPLPIALEKGTQKFSVTLPAYGLAGVLINGEDLVGETRNFILPYPETDDADRAYYAEIEKQKELRASGARAFKKCYVRASVPPITMTFEDSLVVDLYDNVHEFGVVADDGSFQSIGWLAKNGLVPRRPTHEKYLYLGEKSRWMDFTPYLGKKLAMRTFHAQGGTTFYSFVLLEISETPEKNASSYEIRFVNELEPDRAWLHFNL